MTAPGAPAAPALRQWRLSPRLWVGTLGGDTPHTSYGANCTAIAGDRGTLVIDPLIAPPHARLIAAALANAGFPPVTHLFATHHHTDHSLGASVFAAARFLTTAACAAAMAAQHPPIVAARRAQREFAALYAEASPRAPDDIVDVAADVDLGGVRVQLRRVGPAHTDGDAIAVIPSEGAVVCGDLVFAGYHFNYEEAQPDRLLPALAALPAADIYIPGHGAPAGRELVEAQAAYHRAALAGEDLAARFPDHALRSAVASARRLRTG